MPALLIRSAVLDTSLIVVTGGIMESAENELLYLKENPKAIFFTDFDGTITLKDCMKLFPKAFLDPSLLLLSYCFHSVMKLRDARR